MSFLDKIFGDGSSRYIKEISPLIPQINDFEEAISKLSNEELKGKTLEFKERLAKKETLEDILPEAFACVREAAKRTLGERHFDVQLLGGIAMHRGSIAEMRTGEGKTLVATLPAYLNALEGKGVHVVTVNDYLSRRDAVWMGEIYDALGLRVSVIAHESSFIYDGQSSSAKASADEERDEKGSFHIVHEFLKPCSRVEAYEADITYGTNSEFGFDYLRDNLEYKYEKVRQKKHHFAIVDEIDSILIDEARTPLIISAPAADSDVLYKKFAGVADKLKENDHYTVDEKMHAVLLTDEGISKAEEILGLENIYAEGGIKLVHHLETAVKAKALYKLDKDYVVKEDEVIIVDSYTGRLQPGRRWSEGLHQAIEAKENVSVQKESRTFASITYQNYFRMYEKLSGMTGTATTSSEEFYKVYGLNTVAIPTNKPSGRVDKNDLIFQTENGKLLAIAKKVKELQKIGQPVLIGTISIEKNELLGEYLKREGINFEMLNAKNHEREGEIIAQAGRQSGVTVATNMAGRGVDIKLGGAPFQKQAYEKVKNLGGLFVLGTERHDARRIDNQLRGRSGRQGDSGETQFFVSMEDHIMRVFASDTVKNMMGRLGIAEDEAIENKLITRSLESAQEKIEGLNFDARKHILEYDDVLNFQRKTFYERRRNILIEDEKTTLDYLEKISGNALPEIKDAILQKRKELGEENFTKAFRELSLQTFDMFWVDHLEMMDYLRGSVNLRAYGQRDPLVEYKKEGLKLFKEMEESIENAILGTITKVDDKVADLSAQRDIENQALKITSVTDSENATSVKSQHSNLGRNDPCWCGSGKKFKKCHGA
ncbi:MAG: preprotein translocase subunit SecA [Candidatus Zambryskibacteria bacterium RIFCSPLOWO2_01_FULL_39_39]|uniref:Protein translocase subunit SecA n=1 Tax=Candidatus Zambryskibacteria bacterium RIFCSPLOWO2_01_FULL_39_39 TaxID=1802758 RepID=A0A1G2U0Q7_9BACT|nr:MAG: Protein translocase subunit SecA [Parcubacteria group bacterium GW2011_GWA1_38_7]OHA87565.1 MAG: preprotein translocase subunit SecA [Candidatus Zambryskibacteria bacterium RIFCSPHIGHO2_01_FULL_39_63]OHA95092.1 MAG: preprotein translocase subunit SecA [Candidatus Zambryskibacteria bacterium RIFCSPHIGHO2_02_FULL_39_19]OHA98212.1 MAG: preprotein translocase subunit SecA [Candidatus Zambryskibacteria bacterium RIFCSPHIGHO2_12_FULL_39_21]OHB02422.1 MAG: preprotein translocase subunit SecA [